MSVKLVYDGSLVNLRRAQSQHGAGLVVVCPVCGDPLIVALDLEACNRHSVHAGIYCTRDQHHVHELIELAEVHDAVRRLFEEQREDELKKK